MGTPFKLKSGNSPLAWDPFGLKAKKELEAHKKIDVTSKKIEETSKKAKELHAKFTAEDAAEKKATKKHRPPGTSKSYLAKQERLRREKLEKESKPKGKVRELLGQQKFMQERMPKDY